MGSGTDFGAARLRAKGKYGNWNFQLQYDFTSSAEQGIKYAYLQYTGFAGQALTLGNQFEQFGLENSDTTLATTFPSQSVPFAAIGVGPRHLGFAYTILRGPLFWGVGVYGPVPGYQRPATSGSQGIDFASRLGYDPVASPGEVLHFGISGRYHQYGSGNTAIGNHNDGVLGAHAGLALSGLLPVLIAARAPNSRPSHEVNLNGEFAAEYHALSVDGEYYEAAISGLHNLRSSKVTFHGYYAQVQYFLTGESRRFLRSPYYSDIWVPTHPLRPINQGGSGAWEIAARYSEADLNDGSITGGKERDVAVGLNWIPVFHIRFMLDGMRVMPIQGGPNNGASFDAIFLRTQVFW